MTGGPETKQEVVIPPPAAASEPAAPAPAKAPVLTLVPRAKKATPPALQTPAVEDVAPERQPADVSGRAVSKPGKPVPPPLLPVAPAQEKPAAARRAAGSATPFSALDYLNLHRKKADADADAQDAGEEAPQGGGEAPELVMEAEVDADGTLNLRTAGAQKSAPIGEKTDGKPDASRANRSMADDEKNILHHHPADDWEAYSAMQHNQHEPGDFER